MGEAVDTMQQVAVWLLVMINAEQLRASLIGNHFPNQDIAISYKYLLV